MKKKKLPEDIAKTSAHIAALLMHYGTGESEAVKKSIAATGQEPDEDLLQQATKKFGIGKKGRQEFTKHWIRQGAYNPEMSKVECTKNISGSQEIILDSDGKPIDDVCIGDYTLDEAILHLLAGMPVRCILERDR